MTMVPLDAYFVRKSLQNIGLGSAYREKIDKILELLEKTKSDDPRIKVSDVFEALYPELSAASANRGLNRLAQEINAAAGEQGVIALKVSSSKGADKRFVWFEGPAPEPNPANVDDLKGIPAERIFETQGVFMDRIIALVTFNEHETAAVLEKFCPDGRPKPYPISGMACNLLGRWTNGLTIIHCVSEQGENRAQQTCQALLGALSPKIDTIIAVGIAFGVDKKKQDIGDVLVAERLYDYERTRQTKGKTRFQGELYPCSSGLRQIFRHADQCLKGTHSWPALHFGTLLSGNKLIDDQEFRDAQMEGVDNVIGGEMEGVGIYHAVEGKDVRWLVVKAISDWADGDKNNPKKEEHQKRAARHAAHVVHTVLSKWGGSPQGGIVRLSDLERTRKECRPLVDNMGKHVSMDKDVEKTLQPVEARRVNVLEALTGWARRKDGPQFFALLGEYGMGKTIACQRLVRQLFDLRARDAATPLPLYFDLRHVTGLDKGAPTLAKTLEECMERGWIDQNARFTLEQLYQSMASQPAVVILDGLDEVLVKLSEADGQAFTRNLYKIAEDIEARRERGKLGDIPPLKMLISCRTHFFRTLREQKNHFTGQERGQVNEESFAAMLLLPLDEEQVTKYLQGAFPELDPDRLLETLRAIHNLEELSQRPITLKYIADFLPDIEKERAAGKTIRGVSLYEKIALRWLERDAGKHHIHPKHKLPLAMHLAAYLWREGSGVLEAEELEIWLLAWLASDPALERRYRGIHADQLEEDLRTATFLVREDRRAGEKTESHFRFAHTSLLEFFLAKYLLNAIEENKPEHWQIREPSRETLDFLGQLLAGAENAAGLLQTLNTWGRTRREQMNESILRYAVLAREKGWPRPVLRGIDLSGADLQDARFECNENTPLDLSGADFSAANLRRTLFRHVILEDCRFRDAALTQTSFWNCWAGRTDWNGADCTTAIWRDVDLAGSDWTGAQGKAPRFLFCRKAPAVDASSSWREAEVLPTAEPYRWEGEKVRDVFTEGDISSCIWSPDGACLLSGDSGGHLIVWDAQTGQKRLVMNAGGWVSSCAWLPDGAWRLSGDRGGNLIVWDAQTGRKRSEMKAGGWVSSCAWSPDGAWLLSGDQAGNLIVWDAQTGQKRLEIEVGKWVSSCAWSPDGAQLLSGDQVGNLIVWHAQTGQKRLEMEAGGWVSSCAWSPDGAWLLSGDSGGNLIVWDAQMGHKRWAMKVGGSISSCAWSPDGAWLLSGGGGGHLIVWDVQTGQKWLGMEAGGWASSCAWSPDGAWLLSGDGGDNLIVWNAQTGQKRLEMNAGERVFSCAWSPDGAWLLSENGEGHLIVWDAQTGQRRLEITDGGWVSSCTWSPDGAWLLLGDGGGNLIVLDARTGQKRLVMEVCEIVLPCAWSPNGAWLLSGDGGGNLIVWDARTGQERLEMKAGESVESCAWSPDGAWLLSGDKGDNLIVWDAQTGQKRLEMKAGGMVFSCAWSPDGAWLLSGDSGGHLIVWDAQTGQKRLEMKAGGMIYSCAWSPDGAWLVSGDSGGHLIVWDAQTGQKQREFFLFRESQLAWEPATGKVTHASGLFWRDFHWESTLPDGRKAQRPIEVFGKLD